MTEQIRLAGKAILVGVFVGLAFLSFEWLVNHGTEYVWNDVFQTDTFRWGVVPLAVVLSIGFSFLVRSLGQRRLLVPKVDLLEGDEEVRKTGPKTILTIFVIGVASLVAGASLGPEASLLAMSSAAGTWVATRRRQSDHPQLLALASVGALLVAFFGSLLPMVIPALMIYQKRRSLNVLQAVPIALAGLAAYLTLIVVQGKPTGYGSVPAIPDLHALDFVAAAVLGIVSTLLAVLLKRSIRELTKLTHWLDHRFSWTVTSAMLGLGIGMLYLLGGESVQFSGSEGVHLLADQASTYGVLTLAALALIKLLVTAWSEASGYRGGLVFPSVYIGTAVGLLAGALAGGIAGSGAAVGSIGGIMAAMTSPVLAGIMLLSLLPLKLAGLGLTGIAGAFVGRRLFRRFIRAEPQSTAV